MGDEGESGAVGRPPGHHVAMFSGRKGAWWRRAVGWADPDPGAVLVGVEIDGDNGKGDGGAIRSKGNLAGLDKGS